MKLRQILFAWIGLIILPAKANTFYANAEIQQQAPNAFALQSVTADFLPIAYQQTIQDADKLLAAIAADKPLTAALANWSNLSIEQQLPWLKLIFELEVQSFNTPAPTLIIDSHSYPGKMVYFDFDLQQPEDAVVYLNPEKLAQQPPYAALAFLLHETRHGYQFQRAISGETDVLSQGYLAAFTAQKTLSGLGFSDFLTLLNEYEAFQYGNYLIGQLTNWQVDMINMGTFASQYDHQGQLKIDLIALTKNSKELSVLEQYNRLAKAQYELRQQAQ
ncbi:hypothetical protein FLM48_19035 [Shewanella sp. Scap07]|uniref:hypothetical protein n=1 Tax=Shewanella sp. Scap07 TaxID=2589987 RepID=UPI0015BE8EBC|nr:hypothetical protein [Shewanella sp. Scap07]QLE86980.1 hypothetical protein FLM48_19035 [Shewanella sp. Scap07]